VAACVGPEDRISSVRELCILEEIVANSPRLRTFMETDAKGQLGGLECNDGQRRRMACESALWKCPSCNRTNAEIMAECEAAAAAAATECDGSAARPREDPIPTELKMAWKDEIATVKHHEHAPEGDSEDESTALAEGFVATAPTTMPAQSIPGSTASLIPIEQRLHIQSRRPSSSNGVPAWLDGAIVAIATCLVAMIVRLLFLRV
jgi:ubiquitin-conjugating enzyme E2 J1